MTLTDSRWNGRCWAIVPLVSLLLVPGCAPVGEEGGASRDRSGTPREEEVSYARTMSSTPEDSRLIQLVKDAVQEEDGVTYAAWLEERMADEAGNVMFEEWSTASRGGTKYEVRFIYTMMDVEYQTSRKGFSWNVDKLLNIVNPPRELNLVEEGRRKARPEVENRQWLEDENFSLE